MTALNKHALREAANAANIASWGKWESYKPHKGARGYEVKVGAKAVAQHCLKVDSAFIAAANPATVLALLDALEAAENNLIDSECHVAELEESLRDKQALLESAEKRIAELETNKGKPVMFIDGDISASDAEKLAAVIREWDDAPATVAPEEMESRTVTLPDVEKWRSVDAVRAQSAYKVLVSKALTAAGIGVKGD